MKHKHVPLHAVPIALLRVNKEVKAMTILLHRCPFCEYIENARISSANAHVNSR